MVSEVNYSRQQAGDRPETAATGRQTGKQTGEAGRDLGERADRADLALNGATLNRWRCRHTT